MKPKAISHYQIEEKIGSGGMGTVYRGTDLRTQQLVAIKHLKAEVTRPDMIERFKREGEALRELNHPNIVRLLETVEENGSYFLILEYVSGGDLTRMLRQGELPVRRILKLAIDLADALTRAHKLDIIHRDLKPANILIAEDGTLRLTDFGIAHIAGKDRVTEDNTMIGTLQYLSPEALNGDPVDTRADIWAFGVILFEMLCRKYPFERTTFPQVVFAILNAPIPDLEVMRPDAPVALVDLVYRMLARNPHERIASVRLVGAELEAILLGRDTPGGAVSRVDMFATPTPDTLSRPKHNLPAQTTPFIGREAELAEIARLLNESKIRLLTLVAPGGMGKTRLALEAAERQTLYFPDGVYLIELAPLGSFDDALVYSVQRFIDMLRGGYSILQCFEDVARSAPEPVAGACREFVSSVNSGASFQAAFEQMQQHIKSGYFGQVVEVMLTQFREGGNLADRLDVLSESLREHLGDLRWSNRAEYFEGLIIPAIAGAIEYQFQVDGRTRRQQLIDFLSAKKMLLLPDNFEHLIEGAGLMSDILKAAPQVKILVTSRQKLNQSGETVFNLEGMDFPAWETPKDALEYAAVKLFLQSAIRVQPMFEITSGNMGTVARICSLVQGMPLGIVLAAGWLSMLSPEEIAAEIARSVDFLESDMGDLPERQRSLRAVFDYSWSLMHEDEKTVFMKLSVFRGGFTREAAEITAGATLRLLMSLMNKSLIRRDVNTGRYAIHELMRQYAEEQLNRSGETAQTRTAHAKYFARWMKLLEADLHGRRQFEALNDIEDEFDNIRTAWDWSITTQNLSTIGSMIASLNVYCWGRNRIDVLENAIAAAVAALSVYQGEPADGIRAELVLRDMLLHRSYDAARADTALEIALKYNNPSAAAYAYLLRGIQYRNDQDYRPAIEAMEKCRAYYHEAGDTFNGIWTLSTLSECYVLLGDAATAYQYSQEAAHQAREAGDQTGVARALGDLAGISIAQGNYGEAESHLREAMARNRAINNPGGLVNNRSVLALITFLRGDFDETTQLINSTIPVATDLQKTSVRAFVVFLQGMMACLHGDYQTGERCFHEAASINAPAQWVHLDIEWGYAVAACERSDFVAARRRIMTVMQFGLETAAMQFMTWALPVAAFLLAEAGEFVRAVETLSLAYTHSAGVTGWMEQWTRLNALQERLHAETGKKAYNAAWKRGKTLDISETIRALMAEYGGVGA